MGAFVHDKADKLRFNGAALILPIIGNFCEKADLMFWGICHLYIWVRLCIYGYAYEE